MQILLPHLYTPREYQIPLLTALDSGVKYALAVWARRHGKDLTCWNYAIKKAASSPMDVTYVFPTSEMGKNNLWEAKTNDGIRFTDFVPMEIRQRSGMQDDGLNNTYRQILLFNKSIIRLISGDNPDRLRGGNSKLYILSEFAEMDPAVLDIIEPIVEANGGQILVNFTPKGDNHAKGLKEAWENDASCYTQVIKATDTNVFTSDQLIKIKERIINRFKQQGRSETEALSYFDQEYLCSFDSPVIGSYFGEGLRAAQTERRITAVPYIAELPVHTVWDLGIGDSTAIWFYQLVGQEIHFIDYLETSGEGLNYYIIELQRKRYIYGYHYAPHDIEVRELSTGKSRKEVAAGLGVDFMVAPKLSLEDGIEAARRIFNRCWFDKVKTERGVSALKSYQKEFDDKNKIYKEKPLHNWASHGSDAFRYFAVSLQEEFEDEGLPDESMPFASI